MNIIELCLSKAKGGLELYVYRASKELSRTDNIIPVLNENGFLFEKFQEDGYSLNALSISFKPFPVVAARKLARIIDDKQVDAIHMHWARDLPLASLAKKLSKRKPRLVYTRQMQITRGKDDWYHNFIYKEVDSLITITERLADDSRRYLSPLLGERVTTLYYGVSQPDHFLTDNERAALRNELRFNDQCFVVGLFGRIKHEKGQHVLVEAVRKLRESGHDICALIVGHSMDDNYHAQLKAEVENAGLSGAIVFMDFVDNPQHWMQACDAVVLASKEETFGLVLAEAMHAGIAVIGTDSGGVPEIIDHDQTGLLFDFGDVDALCGHIVELKNNPQKRIAFARAGQQKARTLFSLDSHYRQLRKLFAGN
jgi:glycosyltransferase involved in cell wall biosynthesis